MSWFDHITTGHIDREQRESQALNSARKTPDPPSLRSLTHSGKDFGPAASPDGQTVAFTSARDGKQRIWLKQISGGGEIALTDGPNDASPRFSPDGASLLFTRFDGNRPSLFRVAVVGGEARRLVADAFDGDYSPDGREIAFLRMRTEQGVPVCAILTTAADGGAQRSLADFRGIFLRAPRWTPDGQAVVAVQSAAGPTTGLGFFRWVLSGG